MNRRKLLLGGTAIAGLGALGLGMRSLAFGNEGEAVPGTFEVSMSDADWHKKLRELTGGTGVLDRQRTRDERVCGDDHLVAGADAGCAQHDRERRRPRRDAHAVARAAVGGELGLEPLPVHIT